MKTERVEARLSPDERRRIEQAAEIAGESMSSFLVTAAVSRADDVVAAQLSTIVPSGYFDDLVAALDSPADELPHLAAAARRARRRPRIVAP